MGDTRRYRREHPNYFRDRIARTRAYVDQHKRRPCADCGAQYPPPVMELDHVRGKKLHNVAKMAHAGYGLRTIDRELAKCDVVCANCHRLRHIDRGWVEDPAVYNTKDPHGHLD